VASGRAAAGALLALGSLAGAAFLRGRARRRRERVDVYFRDGSFVSVADDSPAAERLLPHARRALAAARA
jgi:hypothetical protein